jgi:catechol 2,3-dioxygenase-like lactoylglutathione lyase family enzyme
MPKFTTTAVFVEDLTRSRVFYHDVLLQNEVYSDQNHVLFEDGLELHLGDVLLGYAYGTKRGPDGQWGHDNFALTFRTDDIEEDFKRVSAVTTPLHPIRMEPWGERFFRFKDPDGHIVEVGDRAS